jgi:hypothetical protein
MPNGSKRTTFGFAVLVRFLAALRRTMPLIIPRPKTIAFLGRLMPMDAGGLKCCMRWDVFWNDHDCKDDGTRSRRDDLFIKQFQPDK